MNIPELLVLLVLNLWYLWSILWNLETLLKNFLVFSLVSKLFQWDSRYLQKHLKFDFIGWYKKLCCTLIVIQKLLCHAILMYYLYYENLSDCIHINLKHVNMPVLVFLFNGFAAFLCIEKFIHEKHILTSLIAIFCCFINVFIASSMSFWNLVFPALAFTFFFLICCGFFLNIFNEDISFETPILETLGMHTERLGGFCLGVYIYEFFFVHGRYIPDLEVLGQVGYIIIGTHFMVAQFNYPEQYILRMIAQSYQREDCAICLENITKQKTQFQLTLTDCYHVFHSECLENWRKIGKDNCPTCRQVFIE